MSMFVFGDGEDMFGHVTDSHVSPSDRKYDNGDEFSILRLFIQRIWFKGDVELRLCRKLTQNETLPAMKLRLRSR